MLCLSTSKFNEADRWFSACLPLTYITAAFVYTPVHSWALPIHFFRHLCCRMYHSACHKTANVRPANLEKKTWQETGTE